MEIGSKILNLRKQKGLSQEQLAEKMHVARQTISKWELGETSPDLSQAKQLSQFFNISLDELTDNDIKEVLVTKISNTERLAGIIINILKVFGILLLILVIIIIFIIISKNYFEVHQNNIVADSYGIYCYVNGEKQYYEATTTKETPDIIDLHSTDEETLKEMNIDLSKYQNKEKVIKDIKKYIVHQGGTCN